MVIERTYVIPLRAGFRNAPAYYRTNRAVKTLRAFLVRHMKVKDEQIKLGQHLNMFLWDHGIKNPPPRVTVNVIKNDEGIVTAELEGAKYTETVRPRAKDDEPQGLKEKLQAAVGGKKDKKAEAAKDDAAEGKEDEASDKPKAAPKKAAKPSYPKE
jgi:large subunit ribosomal protein L31e